jgi:hypothetical protein
MAMVLELLFGAKAADVTVLDARILNLGMNLVV